MNFSDFSDLNLTIVGLGLIGGSFAKSINKKVKIKNLWAVDIDNNILRKAKAEGIIDEGYTDPIIPLNNSDIVIMCTYPGSTLEFIKCNMKYFKHDAIITDTTGIKNKIVTETKYIIRNDLEFIGGHPMSGKENIGYKFSDENMFNDCNYILTPNSNNSEKSINILSELMKAVGFKKVTLMSPEIHDEIIAFTSQLPHIIACALMNSNNIEKSLNSIGGSFKDMTRVADINCDLWCELINENKYNILNEIDNFLNDIRDIYSIIKSDNTEYLKSIFIKSSILRKEMNK